MDNSPVTPGNETIYATQRQSTRIEVAIAVTLVGKDTSGREFRENTRTLIVNKHGAKITTAHRLALGSDLTVENRKLGKKGKAKVVWVGEVSSPKDPLQIGIQLFEAENIWGIEFPPEDWQESPRKAFTRMDEKPAEPPPPKAAPAVEEKPAPEEMAPEIPAVGGENLAEITASIREAIETAAKDFERRLSRLALQIGTQAETHLREAVEERERSLSSSIDAQVRAAAEKLDSAHRDLDVLLQNMRALHDTARREIEAAHSEIQNSAGRAVSAGVEEFSARISAELNERQAGLTEKISQQVAETVTERSNKAAEELVASSTRAVQEAVAASQEKTRQEIDRLSADSLEKHRREAAASAESHDTLVKERLKQHEASLEESLQAAREKLAHSAEEAIAEKSREAKEAFVEDIRRQLSGLTKSTATAMNKQAMAGLDRYQGELKKKSDEEFGAASEKLKKASQDAIAEATELFRSSLAGVFSSLSPGAKKPSKSD